MRRTILILFSLFVLASASLAHKRNFTYTYDWFTADLFEREIELWWTQREGGHAEGLIEFEYGVTDRWTVSPYLIFERESGGEMELKGAKLEQRHRFGDFAVNQVLPAAYFEVKKEDSEEWEIELKAIASYVTPEGITISANLITEGHPDGSGPFKWEYAAGIAQPLYPWTLGVELFGDWTNGNHFYGPAIGFSPDAASKVTVTVGLPSSGGPARVRTLAQFRF